jgi:hypothetical protein
VFEKYSYRNSFNKKKLHFSVSDNIKSKGNFDEEIFVDMLYKYNKLLNVRSLEIILIKV